MQLSLLDDIQKGLTDQSETVANTLRKARLLASQLGSRELTQWTMAELEGYKTKEELPTYRILHIQPQATLTGSFGYWQKNAPIPTHGLPDDLEEWLTEFPVTQNVAALEALVQSKEETYQRKHRPELTRLLEKHLDLDSDTRLYETYQTVPKYIYSAILDSIKNRLVEFVLDLQKNGVNPDDPASTSANSEVVQRGIVNHIYGNNNVVAIGDNISQKVSTVQKGDIGSLIEYLKENNVPDSDMEELRQAIAEDPDAEEGMFGPKVSSWMGGMITKAASGVWQVAVPVATGMLHKGIESYYGI